MDLDKQDINDEEAVNLTRSFYEANANAYTVNTADMADTTWLEKFCQNVPAGGSILDCGCAGGRDLMWFHSRGFAVTGIDISPAMVALAKEQVPQASVAVGNIQKTEFPNATFDGVWCSCVLLHLKKESLAPAIVELARILKDGGYAYFLVKEGDAEGIEADARYGGSLKFASYFTESEMQTALSNAGFTIIDSEDMHRQLDDYRATDRLFYLVQK